jgi:hypothetical protein
MSLAEALEAGSHDVILVFAGEGGRSDAADQLTAKYRRSEVIVVDGSQPVYDYILVLF